MQPDEHDGDDEPVNILLVDDRPENLVALSAILAHPGYNLVAAHSGAEALKAVLRHEFAAILLDVVMPDIDGFEVARVIRSRERSRHIPILFLTAASTDIGSIYRGYSVGAVDYLPKPLDPPLVAAKVAVFAELHRQSRRIRRQAALLRDAERREREHQLAELTQESERRYRNLAESVPEIVWTTDRSGRFVYLNQKWSEYTGHPGSLDEPSWSAVLHPEDAREFLDRWHDALTRGERFEGECRLRRRDGIFRWHLCRAVPECDGWGEVVGWLGTSTEIEAQKRGQLHSDVLAEASRVMSAARDVDTGLQELARTLAETVTDACIIDRVDGTVVRPVAAAHRDPAWVGRLLEVEREPRSPVGGGLDHAADVAAAARVLGCPEAVLAESGVSSALWVPLLVAGRAVGALTLVACGAEREAVTSETAFVEHLATRVALGIDRARLYREAEDAARVREEFLSIASHELRTPLTALQLQLESLVRAAKSGRLSELPADRLPRNLEVAGRQTERLALLIDQLLDMSRIAGGRLALVPEEVDLAVVAREVVSRFEASLARAGCTPIVEVGGSAVGWWDRIRIDQVITNLVSNAMKYASGSPVELRVERNGTRARLMVRDHGPGIARENLDRIFERFERASSDRARGGLGLGLYISRQIVHSHGGTLRAISELGDGSTFVVELPLRRCIEATANPAETGSAA